MEAYILKVCYGVYLKWGVPGVGFILLLKWWIVTVMVLKFGDERYFFCVQCKSLQVLGFETKV